MPTSTYPNGENHGKKDCPQTGGIGGNQEDFRL